MSFDILAKQLVDVAFQVGGSLGQKVAVELKATKTFDHATGVATTTYEDGKTYTGFMSHKNQWTGGTDNQPVGVTTVIFKCADVDTLEGCEKITINDEDWSVDDWHTDPVGATLTATISRGA